MSGGALDLAAWYVLASSRRPLPFEARTDRDGNLVTLRTLDCRTFAGPTLAAAEAEARRQGYGHVLGFIETRDGHNARRGLAGERE